MRLRTSFILCILSMIIFCGFPVKAETENQDCFSSSLHHTGEGMRYWYEAKDGFIKLTQIGYNELGCNHCHSQSCNDCHFQKMKDGSCYSIEKAQKNETCFKCHARAGAVAKIDKERKTLDLHFEAGMVCADCHTLREIHGDGNAYKTMRDPDAKDTACINCHKKDSESYPAIPDTESHLVHKDKLDCNACHVQNTMTCYNCHIGEFQKTKDKAISSFAPIKDFLLLVKYKGKITSGNLQTLVSQDSKPFIVYAPYLTHSIMREGRKCEQCHGTEAAVKMASGKIHTMATFNDGKADFYKGIVPLVPELLEWPFLEKKEGKWITFEPKQKPLIQMGLFAEPFSNDELKKLAQERKYDE